MSTARTDTGPDREPGEPAWTEVFVWTWALRAVLAARDSLRLAAVQYLAAVLFMAATAGLIIMIAYIVALTVIEQAGESSSFARALSENGMPAILGSPALWMVPAGIQAILRRRPGIPAALQVLRAMGAPARESTKAWDSIFRPIDRFLSHPVRWLLVRPRRIIYLAALTTPVVLLFTAGVVAPEQVLNLFVDILGELGKRTLPVAMVVLFILCVLAMIVYGLLLTYVWTRSILAALPVIVLHFFYTVTPEMSFLAPVAKLITFMPANLAAAQESEQLETGVRGLFLDAADVFVGSPGNPTTIGMILTGILLGWLPHLIEHAGKPTPRERVAEIGWFETAYGAETERGYQLVKTTVWSSGLAVLVFGAPGFLLFIQDDLRAGTAWIAILPGAIGVGLLIWMIRRAVEDGSLRGEPSYRFAVHEPGSSPAPDLGWPDYRPPGGLANVYSPLDRLLSEAERYRGTTMQRPRADLVEQD